jgi:RNA polymerase sigma factor (sigma-70 family)
MRLFSLDLVHCPRLQREEEYTLTRRTRSAWNRLLTALQEHRKMAVTFSTLFSDQPSEPDILRFLQQVRGTIRGARFHEWVEKVTGELTEFRACRDEMVRRNLRLVVMLARRHQGRGITLLDLIQEGALGLMRAIEKFDPERHVAFSSYAVWWIREAFSRALLRREDHTCSVDAPLDEDAGSALVDVLTDPEAISPEEALLKVDETQGLHAALAQLLPQEAEIVRLRFGLVDGQVYTYEEIGLRVGIGREQARLWEQRALLRLKHQLRRDANKFVDRQQPSCQKSASPQRRRANVALQMNRSSHWGWRKTA